jgi:acetylornithine deacetylase/succinyl-diaminopimelate desuccinylase-like protein
VLPAKLQPVLDCLDATQGQRLERLSEFLRFRSVGTDPVHAPDCRKAAEWVMNTLKDLGFAASIEDTSGNPVVLGRYVPKGNPHVPHVLFYGHYDVQPSDPDDLWTNPPFVPDIRRHRNGRECIFARGAADDKGQLLTFVEASRAWLTTHGALPFALTVLIEGDEEGDNSHLDRFVAAHRKELASDIAMICDTNMWDTETPAIVTSLRGCISCEVTVHGPRIDLHSGLYGGPVVNPIKALSRIIASLHDSKGRVAIKQFYDGVPKITPQLRKRLKQIPFDEPGFLKAAGLKHTAGEAGLSALEQVWLRPTCEVNGLTGGYTGPGSKTVLPAKASAKFTFRLVGGQNPKTIRKNFVAHVKQNLTADCKVSFDHSGGDLGGVSVPNDSVWIELAQQALKDEWGKPAILAGEGGSIPVVASFRNHLKLDSLLIGFGLDDDAVHSPDEKYDLRSFDKGARSWARLFAGIDAKNHAG